MAGPCTDDLLSWDCHIYMRGITAIVGLILGIMLPLVTSCVWSIKMIRKRRRDYDRAMKGLDE